MANKNQQAAPEIQEQVNKAEAFFEKYKKAIIIGVIAVIVIVVGAILLNNYYFTPRANEASTETQVILHNSTSVSARLISANGRRLSMHWRTTAARVMRWFHLQQRLP